MKSIKPLDETELAEALEKVKSRVGLLILHYRKQSGLSQKALAEYIDVEDRFLRYVEAGERGLGLENLIKAAHILGIDISQLFIENPRGTTINRPVAQTLLDAIADFSDEEIDWLSKMAVEARKLRDIPTRR